jgi:putative ABC transport system permease protein
MIFRIVRANLFHQRLTTFLSVVLLALGTGIISLLLVMQDAFSKKMDRDLKDIDIVVGAKGSPLQLVLSAVYHMDAPTGNIPAQEANRLSKNRMIAKATPLAYGDTYKGYRILGTDESYLEKYEVLFQEGRIFEQNFEAVLGATVAARSGLKIGDSFVGTHGSSADAHEHDEHPYKVVGILSVNGSVIDQLVLTNISTVWAVHHHEQSHEASAENEEAPGEITALLLQLKSPMALMTLPRSINESSSLQAAVPSLEINRLMGLLGIGTATLQGIAVGIILVSALSIFIALYNRMKERQYEMALMRLMGCSRGRLAMMVWAEAAAISLAGYFCGWILSRAGILLLQSYLGETQSWPISLNFVPSEAWMLPAVIIIGTMAAVIPAVHAFRLDISKTLAHD